jgi:hypothetical protein
MIRDFPDASAHCVLKGFSGKEVPIMQEKPRRGVVVGDIVVIGGHRVGDARRRGEIVDVLGEGEREHYRVRWEDDRETIFYPSAGDATIEKPPRRVKKPSADTIEAAELDYEGSVLTHEP